MVDGGGGVEGTWGLQVHSSYLAQLPGSFLGCCSFQDEQLLGGRDASSSGSQGMVHLHYRLGQGMAMILVLGYVL